MDAPMPGYKILVIRPYRLDLILAGEKSLEIRGTPYRPGRYFLGYSRQVLALAQLGNLVRIASAGHWVSLHSQHHVVTETLPYKRTFGLRILSVRAVRPVPFHHPRGPITIVRHRTLRFARASRLCFKPRCAGSPRSHAASLPIALASRGFASGRRRGVLFATAALCQSGGRCKASRTFISRTRTYMTQRSALSLWSGGHEHAYKRALHWR